MFQMSKLAKGIEKKYIVRTILAPVFTIGEVTMEVIIPFIMAKLIDVGIANRDLAYITKYGLLMIGLALLALTCGILSVRFSTVAAQGYGYNLRKKLFSKIQSFSFGTIDKFSTASLITRLTTDVNMSQNVYRMTILMCIRAPVMMIAGALMSFTINTRLAMIFCVAIPVIIVAFAIIPRFAIPRFESMLKCFDIQNGTIQENLIGIREVKANVREDFESEKFRKVADNVRRAQVRAEKIVILLMPVIQLVMYFSMVAVMWFGGIQVVEGSMFSGELISFFTYVTQVLMSLTMLGMVFVSFVIARASNKRIVEVLDQEGEDATESESLHTDGGDAAIMVDRLNTQGGDHLPDGSIDFKDVYFSYQQNTRNYVLTDINLHINSGETVGIMGGTGSSKTTLVSLIPRLYEVSSGEVSVGGRNVNDYDLTTLRQAVSVVLQKNILFSGTIKDNLRWGNENATDEEIIAACRAADADGFIRGFTDGYDTVLGQGGVNVSGGQKQRLCIARALLKNPKILILDDSTSAVDTATEGRIQKALKEMAPETTKLIIAQRISSVKNADKIVVLDDGKISAVGTHEELLDRCEIYREVFESQQQGSGDADLEVDETQGREADLEVDETQGREAEGGVENNNGGEQ